MDLHIKPTDNGIEVTFRPSPLGFDKAEEQQLSFTFDQDETAIVSIVGKVKNDIPEEEQPADTLGEVYAVPRVDDYVIRPKKGEKL